MCSPRKGQNTPTDLKREAVRMESGSVTYTNGKAWDAFWKILSLMVLPWATAVTILVWNLTVTVTSLKEEVRHSHEEFNRRLEAIEVQMDPAKRFYRWDGEALEKRVDQLEGLHPRNKVP